MRAHVLLFISQVSADRVLALPLAADAMAKLDAAVRAANTIRSMKSAKARAEATQSSDHIIPTFSAFYSHLDGTARCYDIFDAGDTTLWAQALPFSHIFVFPTAAHARRALDSYSSHLVPIAPLLLQLVPAQAGLGAADANNVMFRIWFVSASHVWSKTLFLLNFSSRSGLCIYMCVVCSFQPAVQLSMQHIPGAVPRCSSFTGSDPVEHGRKQRGAAATFR